MSAERNVLERQRRRSSFAWDGVTPRDNEYWACRSRGGGGGVSAGDVWEGVASGKRLAPPPAQQSGPASGLLSPRMAQRRFQQLQQQPVMYRFSIV